MSTAAAMRNASRNGSPRAIGATGCVVCGQPRSSPRGRYCSAACRQRAFRLRRVAPLVVDHERLRADLRRRGALIAHTLYECSRCGERLLGERRCPDCHVFSRALGLGGCCPHCDEPVLLADLLELEVVP
jgi:ribosomal protein L32